MQEGRHVLEEVLDELVEVDGVQLRGEVRDDPDRLEDRVHQAIQPLDLLDGALVPRGARLAAGRVARRATVEDGLLGEQVRVGPHDRQRRAQLVGHERDELVARLVEGHQLGDLRLGLALEAALLEDPREQVRDRGQLRDVLRRRRRAAPRSGC